MVRNKSVKVRDTRMGLITRYYFSVSSPHTK